MCDIFLFQLNHPCERTSEAIGKELRHLRTILGRFECSFAKQEAKLDRLLSVMAGQTQQAPHCKPQTPSLVIPYMNPTPSSVEFPPPPAVLWQHEMPADLHQFVVPAQSRTLTELADSPMEKDKQSRCV